jgi:hypothetical protein
MGTVGCIGAVGCAGIADCIGTVRAAGMAGETGCGPPPAKGVPDVGLAAGPKPPGLGAMLGPGSGECATGATGELRGDAG